MEARRIAAVLTVVGVAAIAAFVLWSSLNASPVSVTAVFSDPAGHPMEYDATITVRQEATIECEVGSVALGTDTFGFSLSPGEPTKFNGELTGGSGADGSEDSVPIDCSIVEEVGVQP